MPTWKRDLGLLWMGQFLVTAGLTIIVPLLPFYLEELGSLDTEDNRRWTGLALAAPAIPLTIMAPLWGRVGDRFGRKTMVVRALGGIGAAVIAMGLARSPGVLFGCRLAQGALGGVDDAAASFASSEVPEHARGRALGWLQSATASGALVGPLAGGFLSVRWGFGPLILATGMAIAVCTLAAARWLSDPRPMRDATARPARASIEVVRATFAESSVRGFLLAGCLVQVGTYALIGLFAEHVRSMVGSSEAAISWVGTLQSLTWGATLLGTTYWGRRNDRAPVARNFAIAAAICALSIGLQPLMSAPLLLVPLRIAQGFSSSALGQSVFLRVARSSGAEERGLRIGIANSMLTLGHVIGAFAGAGLLTIVTPTTLFALIALCFVVAASLVTRADFASWRNSHHVQSSVS